MDQKKAIVLDNGTITNLVEQSTGLSVNYKPVSQWYDGTTMSDAKCDGDLYRKAPGGAYVRKVIDKDGELFLEKDTMAQMRALSAREILYLKAGVYKGVKLNGYHIKGDTPASIDYYISPTALDDDGGSVIAVGGVNIEHEFESIDPVYFGAVGDGIADDSDDIQKVLQKGSRVHSDKKFKITKPITATSVTIDITKLNILLDGDGIGNGTNIRFNENVIKTGLVNNSTTIPETSKVLQLDDATGISIGDILVVKCVSQTTGAIVTGGNYVITSAGGNFSSVGAPNNSVGTEFIATSDSPDYGSGGSLLPLWDFDPRAGTTNVTYGEVVKVVAVSGDTITLDVPLMTQYNYSWKVQYDVYRPKPLNISGLNIYASQSSLFGGLGISNKLNAYIENSILDKVSGSVGISVSTSYNTKINNVEVNNGYYAGTTTSYGIQDNGSTSTVILNSKFSNNRRAVDFSGNIPSHLGVVNSCTVVSNPSVNNNGSCVGTHGGADLTTFENNTFIGGIVGVQVRSGRVLIKGNTFVNPSICAVSSSFGNSLTIEDNKILLNKDYSTLVTPYFIQTNPTSTFTKSKPLLLKNNTAQELRIGFIGFSAPNNEVLQGIQLMNNNISLRSNASVNKVGLFVNTASTGQGLIRRAIILGNVVNSLAGTYQKGVNIDIDNIYNYGDYLREIFATDVVKWSGAGNLSNITIELKQSSLDNLNVNLKGFVSFTVSGGSTGVKIQNIIRSNINTDLYSNEGNNLMVSTAGELFIGYEIGDRYIAQFPNGTYRVSFNINYFVNDTYKY